MKKAAVFFIALILCGVGVGIYYSPLTAIGGDAYLYDNNIPIARLDGLCYGRDDIVRVDMTGGEAEMYAALDAIDAVPIETGEAGDCIVVYAFSPRVRASAMLRDGKKYNVMAAVRDGKIAIGAPVLSGSY